MDILELATPLPSEAMKGWDVRTSYIDWTSPVIYTWGSKTEKALTDPSLNHTPLLATFFPHF